MCDRVFSVGFGHGLDSVPQGVGAPSMAGLPKKLGVRASGECGVGGYNLHSPPDCGTPTTSRMYPFGAWINDDP